MERYAKWIDKNKIELVNKNRIEQKFGESLVIFLNSLSEPHTWRLTVTTTNYDAVGPRAPAYGHLSIKPHFSRMICCKLRDIMVSSNGRSQTITSRTQVERPPETDPEANRLELYTERLLRKRWPCQNSHSNRQILFFCPCHIAEAAVLLNCEWLVPDHQSDCSTRPRSWHIPSYPNISVCEIFTHFAASTA